MPNASNTERVVAAIGGQDTTADPGRHRRPGPPCPVTGSPPCCPRPWPCPGSVSSGSPGTGVDVRRRRYRATPARTGSRWPCRSRRHRGCGRRWSPAGVAPAGLGARDTLRLEAALPLHGHELGPGITPLQAGLGWVVGWDKGDFRGGRPSCRAGAGRGPTPGRPVSTEGRQPPREGAVGGRRRRAASAPSPVATSRRCSSTASPWPSSTPGSTPPRVGSSNSSNAAGPVTPPWCRHRSSGPASGRTAR